MSLSDYRIALAVLRLRQFWLHSLFRSGFGPRAGMHKSRVSSWRGFVHPWHRASIPCWTKTWRDYILVAMVRGTGGLDLTWHSRRLLCFKHVMNDALKGPTWGGGRLFQTYRLNSGMWSHGSSFIPPWHRYPFSLTNKPSLPLYLNQQTKFTPYIFQWQQAKENYDSWPYCTWFCHTPCWKKWASILF